jgi:hypothetical protein
MPRPVLAIQLEFGFHEIKKFIHSGFVHHLQQHTDIVWLAIDKGNQNFDTYFRNTGFPLVYIPMQDVQLPPSPLETRHAAIRQAWIRNQDKGGFHNYKQVKKSQGKDWLWGHALVKKITALRTYTAVYQRYPSIKIQQIFQEYQVTHVLSTGYASAFAKSFFVTADTMKLPCFYLVNSWKDLYTNDFIPFLFLKKVMVWDEAMKQRYLEHQPELKPDSIAVTGNPTFDVLRSFKPFFDRNYYSEKYNLKTESKWLLYTLMPPGLVNDEIHTVVRLAHEVLQRVTEQPIQFIVRLNPNHDANEFTQIALPPNCRIAHHYCVFDSTTDMIVQSEEGEREWLDLVYHAYANCSVPSTVTLEFLTLGKPVFNIAFNADNKEDERIQQHFNAGFYRPLWQQQKVWRSDTVEEFLQQLKEVKPVTPIISSESASEKVIQQIFYLP